MVDIGDRARSREGHAAMSMRGGDDRWIQIQQNTFVNWVNEQLREVGESVEDVTEDFDNGIKLCLLMEHLRGKKVGRVIKKPINQHQWLENVTLALRAMQADNIKLVNIGAEDIVNGNRKLILGMIWHLILRYQIGKTKFPPKKLMLAWINAVAPDCHITNFSRDWNDGIALNAVLDYCKPGLSPDWRVLSRHDGLNNCRNAMELAQKEFDIPLVVRPEDLSSPDMDDLSGMTYLSYFMKLDSPGYHATLRWVRGANKYGTINNFTTDWQDGYAACSLVQSLGGSVVGWPDVDRSDPVGTTQLGIDGGRRLGVEPILTAAEMVDSQGEHLGNMAYAASFQHATPTVNPSEQVSLTTDLNNVRVGQTSHFLLVINDDELDSSDIRVEVVGPSGKIPASFDFQGTQAEGTFIAQEAGPHKLNVFCKGQLVQDCPRPFTATGDKSKVHVSNLDTCTVGALTEFNVNAIAAGDGSVRAQATAPSGRCQDVTLVGNDGNYRAEFEPDEVGDWGVSVFFENEHIRGSPFNVKVFDPSAVKISGLESGTAGQQVILTADCSEAGEGDLACDVRHNSEIISNSIHNVSSGRYHIAFTPPGGGKYQVYTRFGGREVKGSPHTIEIVDSNQVIATGEGLGLISINRETSFDVNAYGAHGGDIAVEVTAPDQSNCHVNVIDTGNSTYRCEWTPHIVGDHRVDISYAGLAIKDSPFTARVCSPADVRVTNVGPGRRGKPAYFNLDASKAGPGNLEIIVSADGNNVPNYVKPEGNARFEVSYTPEQTVLHTITVRFNNEHVPGSPYACNVIDGSACTVNGDMLYRAIAHRQAHFNLNTQGAGEGDCEVEIFSPSGMHVPARISGSFNTGYRIEFTPEVAGRHQVHVKYADTTISGSPFTCSVWDISQVKFSGISAGKRGERATVEIDCTRAGEGDLSAEIRCKGQGVPCDITARGQALYQLSFVPQSSNAHNVDILFNDEQVPGSPFDIDIKDDRRVVVTGDAIRSAPIARQSYFQVSANGADLSDLNVRIVGPSQKEITNYTSLHSGDYRVEFTPREVGGHHIHVALGQSAVIGSPFTCYVYDAGRVRVRDISDNGIVGKEMHFVVDASEAGQGDIDAEVTNRSRLVRTTRENLGNDCHRYTYIPEEEGDHTIDVTYNYEKVRGSPFLARVTDPTRVAVIRDVGVKSESSVYRTHDVVDYNAYQTHQESNRYSTGHVIQTTAMKSSMQDLSSFLISLDGAQYSISDLQLVVTAPNGEQVPAKIIKTPNGEYKVEYSTTHVGRHTIDIYYNGQRIGGSPYYVDVFDPQRVRVEKTSQETFVNQETGLHVFSQEAGRADLTAKVFNPSGVIIASQILDTANGTRIAYKPTEYGIYKIYAYYGGVEVPGCPIIQEIRANQVSVTVHGDGLYSAVEGSQASFYVDSQGAHGDLFVQVDGPNSIAKCNIIPERQGYYRVTYTPVECGTYEIQVKWNGQPITGSPFRPLVSDARRIQIIGGWESIMDSERRVILTTNQVRRIAFDTSYAGPGTLRAEVKGPYGQLLPLQTENQGSGQVIISFTPVESGLHVLSVFWGDRHMPGSPFTCFCQAPAPTIDHTKVALIGQGVREAKVREETSFIIDGSQAGPGFPDVKISGVKADIATTIDNLGGDKYKCRYVPTAPGAYLLHVQWADRAVRDSPFKLNVIASGDASKVVCTGDGLKMGIMNRSIQSVIDTRRAGPGELVAQCQGPQMVAFCELYDHNDGTFTLNVKPQEPGKHLLHIRYGEENVPGSPFVLKIAGAPDASKVRVKGPGVEHGILATFQSRFLCETGGAGAGQLTVRIRGPKAAFRVEMQRESQKDRNILCRFDPTEVGDYEISVKWSGVDVPGSPFHIQIFDTHDELERFFYDEQRRGKSIQNGHGDSIYNGYGQRPWNAEI